MFFEKRKNVNARLQNHQMQKNIYARYGVYIERLSEMRVNAPGGQFFCILIKINRKNKGEYSNEYDNANTKNEETCTHGLWQCGQSIREAPDLEAQADRRKIRIQCHRNSNCDGLAREPREFDRHRSGCGTS